MLVCDTIYRSLKSVSGAWHAGHVDWFYCWTYLRFWQDGVFVMATIAGNDSDQINASLQRQGPNTTHGTFSLNERALTLYFDDNIKVSAYINNDRSIVVDGKLGWDLFRPLDKDIYV